MEMTSGRRDLPSGSNFGEQFTKVKTIAREKTQKWETAWKPTYDAFIKHFDDTIREMQKNAPQQEKADA